MLETRRLLIRRGSKSDIHDAMQFRNTEFVRKYNMMKLADEKDMLDELLHSYVMLDKQNQQVIGILGVEEDTIRYGVKAACISYYMNEGKTHHGYMREAVWALTDELFHHGFDVVSARILSGNSASMNVLRHLGFHHEGTVRYAIRNAEGIIFDDMLFSILKDEWK